MATVNEIKLGSLPALEIVHSSGSSMKICLFGATIYSFVPKGSSEKLFMSKLSKLDGSKPLRGGIPVVFPQFKDGRATIPNHGFARSQTWTFKGYEEEGESVRVGLVLKDNADTMKMWNFRFQLELSVVFDANSFTTELHVSNHDSKAFRFQALLHTYHLFEDISKVTVYGLDELRYLDQLRDFGDKMQVQSGDLPINKETDWIYKNGKEPNDIVIKQKGKSDIVIRIGLARGHTRYPCDNIVWNPWIKKSKAMGDFGDDEYKQMLCVEPGCVSRYEVCEPEETWTLTQQVIYQ